VTDQWLMFKFIERWSLTGQEKMMILIELYEENAVVYGPAEANY